MSESLLPQPTQPVSGTVTANLAAGTNNIGDVDVLSLPTLPAGTNAIGKLAANSGVDIGDVDVTSVPADPFGANADAASATGSISAKLRFIANTGIPVTGTVTVGSHAVTNAGTFATQAAGDVAHDAADSGSPQKIGGQARTTNPTAVADADRVNFIADDLGRQVMVAGQVRDLIIDQTTTITSSTTETTILTAAASTFHDMTAIMLTNTSATATRVDIRDDTAGTIRMSFYLPAGDTRGMVLSRPRPQTAVNKNWTAQCGTSVDGVRIWIQAEKNV